MESSSTATTCIPRVNASFNELTMPRIKPRSVKPHRRFRTNRRIYRPLFSALRFSRLPSFWKARKFSSRALRRNLRQSRAESKHEQEGLFLLARGGKTRAFGRSVTLANPGSHGMVIEDLEIHRGVKGELLKVLSGHEVAVRSSLSLVEARCDPTHLALLVTQARRPKRRPENAETRKAEKQELKAMAVTLKRLARQTRAVLARRHHLIPLSAAKPPLTNSPLAAQGNGALTAALRVSEIGWKRSSNAHFPPVLSLDIVARLLA